MRSITIVRHLLLATVLTASASGCGGKSGAGEPSAAYNRNVITEREIASVEVRTTALQLIQRMRPTWLQGRGPTGVSGETPLVVYVNNQRRVDSPLSRYTAAELIEIRFLNAMEATQRFGTGHSSGAILLATR